MRRLTLMNLCDHIRLRLLTRKWVFGKPFVEYQPVPLINSAIAKRTVGCQSRLLMIRECLSAHEITKGIVVDYGCNVAFFSLNLSVEGFFAFGVEENERLLSIGYTVSNLFGARMFCPIQLRVTLETVDLIPDSDVTLCLSIWHHWVRTMGLHDATRLLKTIHAKTRRIMFFDTGEREMPQHYYLPFENKDARSWLQQYLREELGGMVLWLGQHKAFTPGHTEDDKPVMRNLFAVVK